MGAVGLIAPLSIPASGYHQTKPTGRKPASTAQLLGTHGRILGITGLGQLGVSAVRFGRLTLLPLYAQSIGLDASEIGLAIAAASAVDFVLFPVAGWLMDTLGRLYAIVPSFLVMSIGLLLLPQTSSTSTFILVGIIIGIGNGLGAGTMLTLSVDLAPADNPARFLGILRMLSDGGRIAGTILVGAVADQLDLGASSVVLAIIGLATAGLFAMLVGETYNQPKPSSSTR